MKGKLKNGFAYEIADDWADDMELIELYAKVQKDGMYFPELLDKILGEDQKAALYDSLRDKKGKVHVQDVADAIAEIFSQEKN